MITIDMLKDQYNGIEKILANRIIELSEFLRLNFESNELITRTQSIINLKTRLNLIKEQITFIKQL